MLGDNPYDSPFNNPIRESLFVLARRIAVLQIGLGLAGLLAGALLFWLVGVSERNAALLLLMMTGLWFTLQLTSMLALAGLLVRWMGKVYIITKNEIIVQAGIARLRHRIYPVEAVSSAAVRQTACGRLFNYGTVTLYITSAKEEIQLRNIPQPLICNELLDTLKDRAKHPDGT